MAGVKSARSPHLKRYLTGFVSAIALTALSFVLVGAAIFSKPVTLAVIAIAAIAQILIHLRYFLNLTFSPRNTWFVVAIVFTALILLIMAGGTLWIIFDLNRHMML
ncbi:MAG: cytochrome o ubiquinol oxidase subunit IV [Chromatiaceae bacterium]|nr:cytochrome o ubiquinol oxidase subunit IV [Chromatiaceae bacterium]MCP5314463.1 cytochrome o ubiquinol oxidase subunit IV [Chromatiaceae bacterium]